MDTDTYMEITPRIAVIGVGGAGCNLVSHLIANVAPYHTIAINTDRAALVNTLADKRMYICRSVTKGHGTGGDSLLGKRCAQAHIDDISEAVKGFDIVFVVAGMGGGTGTGAAPIVVDAAQRAGAITLAIAINPFPFETARINTAVAGCNNLRAKCPMLTVVENGAMAADYGNLGMDRMFALINEAISLKIASLENKIMAAFHGQLADIGGLAEEASSVPESVSYGLVKAL